MAERQSSSPAQAVFSSLHERVKELNCLYSIEEILSRFDLPLEDVFHRVIEAIPPGWQFPECCQVRITCGTDIYESPYYEETDFKHCADIHVQDSPAGNICISYKKPTPESDCGPFLKGEMKLLETIAERLGHFILHQRLRQIYEEMNEDRKDIPAEKTGWRVALTLLRNTDPNLLIRISRKMANYLGWRGVTEARDLLHKFSLGQDEKSPREPNIPISRASLDNFFDLTEHTFRLASANLPDEEILTRIQKWINEDKSSTAVASLENVYADLAEVLESMRRIKKLAPEGIQLARPTANSVRVALIRRFFTDQLDFINVAKKYVDLEDFYDLMERIVFPQGSHGKLGGKSAGLFLACRILRQASRHNRLIGKVTKPRTWYIPSDGMMAFVHYNNLDEVIEQKYRDLEIVRQDYPHLVQVFKHSAFPPEIIQGLSVALDDFGEVPLIVRSSSLLEDRLGSAFAGKYKSLFLANRGDKKERLAALLDAIAEVYASTFSPDPIQYRAERGLLDFYEEMGIMIQAVVGRRAGRYYFPTFAGVAFSRNEFRWSPRIRREDGLARIVPGLGTRAVDRISDDYPVLISPAQPSLRVNVSIEETIRYSPKKIDLIDLEDNKFATREVKTVLDEAGPNFPALTKVFSIYSDGILQRPMGLATDFRKADAVVTFEGLIESSPFMAQLEVILKTLETAMGVPVDIEFACDGQDLYLLQCRPQSYSREVAAMEIPAGLAEDSILFTARKFVANGAVSDINYIVYVDPENYGNLPDFHNLFAVGEAVGRLNKVLPRRQFILMGPGRWGSRGDIKLGVRVNYSDISNTAMVIEIARKKGNYVPEVSFGTHFFQDLVETGIRYLPLYPDDPGVKFNEIFFDTASNKLAELLPEYSRLASTLRVISVPEATGGRSLQVVMNADRELAMGYLTGPGSEISLRPSAYSVYNSERELSGWRERMIQALAGQCCGKSRGVRDVYLIKNEEDEAGLFDHPLKSVVNFTGNARQRRELETWLEGWNAAATEARGPSNWAGLAGQTGRLFEYEIISDEHFPDENALAAKLKIPPGSVRKVTPGERRT